MSESLVPPTFIFAPEIEQALVAAAFQKPERIALVYRRLDPAVHINQPHLRHILEAIDLAYRELGATDFASVIQVLRELGRLEACGGAAGVNSVLEEYRYGFSNSKTADRIIAHYIKMLKTYAVNRKAEPPLRTYRFAGGQAALEPNKFKRQKSDPDYIGAARIAGKSYSVYAWKAPDGSFLNLNFAPK